MDLGTFRADTMTRQLDRQPFDEHTRIALLEQDVDAHDKIFESFQDGMNKLNVRLLAFIITFATSGVLLAADVALRK